MKGGASRWRLEMLDLLKAAPSVSEVELAEKFRMCPKNASEHLRRLTIAGLVRKQRNKKCVSHFLTDDGKRVCLFLHSL